MIFPFLFKLQTLLLTTLRHLAKEENSELNPWLSGGGSCGDSLCKGCSCHSCRSAKVKVVVVVLVMVVVVVA